VTPFLEGAVRLLATAGALALLLRLIRAAGRAALRTADLAAAAGVAEVSARRGDLTRLGEGRAAQKRARLGLRRAIASAGMWLGWLVIPLLLGGLPEAYVLAAPLWLLRYSGR
jgi:hypothetical protein